MCGIAGQIGLGPRHPVDFDDVATMTDTMVHRGPDDSGLFLDPARRVALGMRRLAVIDPASGQQPVFNEDGRIACVFNGEIYNFASLRRTLERSGHTFKSQTDTEVIVHLYEELGVACVAELRGMFAFALWDGRDGSLLVARDRLGKKPLYYAQADGRLSFASEISALARLPHVRRTVDPVALDLYLTWAYVPSPHSIYEAVRKLPPAHYLRVRGGAVEVRRYWSLTPGPPLDLPRGEIVLRLRERLREAVRLRLVSDVPLGCFLSGGIDSSAVVGLMSELSPTPVRTFAIGFSDDEFDELGYARAVAGAWRTDHHEFVVEPDAVEELPAIARHLGEPFGDSSAVPTWCLSKLARRHVTVALNGDGGDELFAGYSWYRRARSLDRLARAMPAAAGRLVGALAARAPSLRRVGRVAETLGLPAAGRFTALRRFIDPEAKAVLYGPGLRAARGDVAERYLDRHWDEAAPSDVVARAQYTDLVTYLPEDLLVKVDRMTMAHGLEGRSPLLDDDLVEFCARIPSSMKLERGVSKAIFRDAVVGLVPEAILQRPKMGFSMPIARWLRHQLRDACYRKICDGALMDTGWLDPPAVRRLVDEHMSGAADWRWRLWNLLMLAEWLEQQGT